MKSMENKFLYKYILTSFIVVFVFPYLLTKLPLKEWGLILSIIYFIAVLPIYFIAVPLSCKKQSKALWILPIINILFFLITSVLFFNSGITVYLAIYVALSYFAITIKYFSQSNQ